MNKFGERIQNRCNELKISIPELAEVSGINYKTLYGNMNKDKPNPTMDILKRLSISLGISIDSLVFGEKITEDEEMGIILKEIKTLDKADKKRIMYIIRMMIAESKNRDF